jgi:hypothetical protein
MAADASAPVVAAPPPREPPSEQTAFHAETGHHEVHVVLHSGDAPCTLLIDGIFVSESADSFTVGNVSRIATAASGACAEAVLYDVVEETKAMRSEDDDEPMPLHARHFLKPGHSRPSNADEDWDWNRFADMNFDGYADLCVVVRAGTWGYQQRCWLFEPHKRVFVREKALEPLIFMRLDPSTRTISSEGRIGFCEYVSTKHAWYAGHLVETMKEITNCERPNGTPVPDGSTYLVRRERRAGRMVKTFDGLVKSPRL